MTEKEYQNLIQRTLPTIDRLAEKSKKSMIIDNSFYVDKDVKRGLRDIDGKGVLAGLTEISEIIAFNKNPDGSKGEPCDGILRYRGYNIKDIVNGFIKDNRQGFEESAYLLLFGELPSKTELAEFCDLLASFRHLPPSFVRDFILKAPPLDMMNGLSRGVLTLYSYDPSPDCICISNVLRQCIALIAQFPLLSVYSYHAKKHYHDGESLYIHHPDSKFSTAQNFLKLLRVDEQFSDLEAKLLDLMFVLHAEHGGGNNSTFATHVVSSSGSDTYSTIAAALGSLKGPRHGGANNMVAQMVDDIKANVKSPTDKNLKDYLAKIASKKAFDRTGLIYGIGHAVYSLSDPRAVIMKKYVEGLSKEKNRHDDFMLYDAIERLAPEIIASRHSMYKGVSANVDFYSGFVNSMLGIPQELYSPIFAIARMAGWSAHRIEELANNGKIIRPNYECVTGARGYVGIGKR